MATVAPAAALGAWGNGLGTLAVGAEADVTVLALEEGRTSLVDSHGIAREADRRLVPTAVLRAGVRAAIEPLVERPPKGIAPG